MAVSWKDLKRHPLSAEYKDLTGPGWLVFLLGFKDNGILGGRKIMLHEGMVLDGWQMLRACIELNLEPEFETLPEGIDAATYVETVNDKRRHETPEEAEQRIAARRKRIAAARSEGKSTRTIADDEGVSQKTVLEDLKKSGDGGSSPGAKPQKIQGADKKTYSAAPKPTLCQACQSRQDRGKPLIADCPDCKALRRPAKAKPKPPLCERCKEIGERVGDCGACQHIEDNPPPPPPKPEPPVMDDAGTVVPAWLITAAKTRELRKKFAAQLNAAAKTAKEIEKSPAKDAKPLDSLKPFMRFYEVFNEARARNKDLDFSLVCDLCEGGDDCKKCHRKGWLTVEEARHAGENK